MYLARSQAEGLALAVLSMVCWGSWSNAVVFCGSRLRFELFYVNYVVAILATSVLAALTLGMIGIPGCQLCETRVIPDDLHAGWDRFCLGMAAGAIFNVANLMLTKGIQMCGLAVAFPLCIGTALVFGTLLTHFLESHDGGEPALLFTGVAVAFAAVCTISLVHRLKDAQGAAAERKAAADAEQPAAAASAAAEAAAGGQQLQLPAAAAEAGRSPRSPFSAAQRGTAEEKSPMAAVAPPAGEAAPEAPTAEAETEAEAGGAEAAGAGREAGAARKLLVCVMGGVLMSFWAPLNALAQDGFGSSSGPAGLSPFGAFFAFCTGTFLSTLPLIPLVLAFPLEGGPGVPILPVLREYRRAPCAAHAYGLLGGFVWAVGTLSNSVSGQQLSFAASYAIGQSAPMISILWGVFLFREFSGTSVTVKALLVFVCCLYVISIALISSSH